jgi:hypothetical protein
MVIRPLHPQRSVAGTQSIGVRTPKAAAVADATTGLTVPQQAAIGMTLTEPRPSSTLMTRLGNIISKVPGPEP